MTRHSHFGRSGAIWFLAVLFAVSLGAQFIASVFENWQSEWLQLVSQGIVLLGMKHLIFNADAEDMEQVQSDLTEIKQHLGIAARTGS